MFSKADSTGMVTETCTFVWYMVAHNDITMHVTWTPLIFHVFSVAYFERIWWTTMWITTSPGHQRGMDLTWQTTHCMNGVIHYDDENQLRVKGQNIKNIIIVLQRNHLYQHQYIRMGAWSRCDTGIIVSVIIKAQSSLFKQSHLHFYVLDAANVDNLPFPQCTCVTITY